MENGVRNPIQSPISNLQMKEAEALQDAGGHTVGWTRPWGRGKLIAYGIFPDAYTTTPHPSANMTGLVRQLIRLGDLKFTGRWAS